MDMKRMDHFLVVAQCLNLSKAAERLYISRQALTKQIRLLEEECGAKLLEQRAKHIVLTEIGKKAFEIYAPMSEALRQCDDKLAAFITQKKAFIRIGYFNGLPYSRVVAPIIQFLSQRIPDLSTSIVAVDAREGHQMLLEDQIDLSILPMAEHYAKPGMKYTTLITLPQKIIVSERHPWYHKDRVTLDDISNGHLVCYEESNGADKYSFMKRLPVKDRVFVRNISTYIGTLSQGTAFGVVSELHSQSEGNPRLLDMPPGYADDFQLIAAYKPLHPRVEVFELLGQVKL